MKTLAVTIAIIGTIWAVNWLSTSHREAMEACQVKHSYDTCAYALR